MFCEKRFYPVGYFVAKMRSTTPGIWEISKDRRDESSQFEKWSAVADNQKSKRLQSKNLQMTNMPSVWNRYSSITKIDQMGFKAGDKMEMTSIEVLKSKDGKIIEHWTFMTPEE